MCRDRLYQKQQELVLVFEMEGSGPFYEKHWYQAAGKACQKGSLQGEGLYQVTLPTEHRKKEHEKGLKCFLKNMQPILTHLDNCV